MGYEVKQRASNFKIKGENLEMLLKDFRNLRAYDVRSSSLQKDIRECNTLEDYMKAFGWKFVYSKSNKKELTLKDVKSLLENFRDDIKAGNNSETFVEDVIEEILNRFPEEVGVVNIVLENESMYYEDILFKILAPYVEKDSYIEMCGAEKEIWRWVFDGISYAEKTPKVEW